jgi:hypothetical protein
MPSALLDKKAVAAKQITLRCFSYPQKRSGLVVAECIDLDLMVKARKPNKAMRELQDAVIGYVKVAVDSGDLKSLIPRPSPLSHRLHYHAVCMLSRFSRTKKAQLLILAFVCLVLAAVGVPSSRISLGWLGLAFWVLSTMVR